MIDPGVLYNQALEAGRQRRYRESLALLQQVATESDDFPKVFLYIGRCFHALKKPALAVLYYRRHLSLHPDSLSGMFHLGRSHLSLDLTTTALRYLLKVYHDDPNYPGLKALIGMAYLRMRQLDDAVALLGDGVVEDPENSKLYLLYLNSLFLMAIRHFHRGEYEQAEEIFRFIEERQGDHIVMYLYLGMIYRELNDHETSLDYFNKAVSASPNDQLLRIQRSEALYRSGRKEEAKREWSHLSEVLGPQGERLAEVGFDRINALEHFNRREYKKCFFFATKVLRTERDPRMHLLAAEASRSMGETSRAENHYRQALSLDSTMLEPRYGLAMMFWESERYDDVIGEMEILKRKNPDDRLPSYYTVLCRERMQEPVDELLPQITQAIQQTGPDPYLFCALGNLYIRGGMPELSEKWFRKALLLLPEFMDAYSGLFQLVELRPREWHIELLTQFLVHNSGDHASRIKLGELLVKEERFEESIQHLESALPSTGSDPVVLRLLAYAYRCSGHFHQASLFYKSLLKDNPKHAPFLFSLVYCLEKENRRPLAIELMEKGVSVVEVSASYFLILGLLLYRQERLDDALKIFRVVVEREPGNWRGHYNIGVVYRDKGQDEYAQRFFWKAEKIRVAEER